jgi:hypothetical protein
MLAVPMARVSLCRLAGHLGLILACGGDAPPREPADAGISGPSGGGGGPPSPNVQAIAACELEDPCPDSFVQLIEGSSHNINSTTLCMFTALAQRRVGRYRHDTNSTFGNGNAGAYHNWIVSSDGTVVYVREPYRQVYPPANLGDLPPIEPLRCTLKPATYFEACRAAVEVLLERGSPPPYPADDEVAWSCTFGDGAVLTPSNLLWFESCVSETPLQCE